jgi:hypothetical protein
MFLFDAKIIIRVDKSLNLLPLILRDFLHSYLVELLERTLKGLLPPFFLAQFLLKARSYAFRNLLTGIWGQRNVGQEEESV